MKFRYSRYNEVLRPVIPIKLRYGSKEIGYLVLVDSGADLCLFDAELGREIGIDIEKGNKREVFGVGGKASIYYTHRVTIEVGGWPFEIEAGFMIQVAGHTFPYGVVGQRGFFDRFVVKFDFLKEEVELKERR
ncbi:MAG: hypothetical protein A2836_01235 [Candidatus Taylorbacteria bacterium RIFCSPHIGHO2_01_FULL_45_63]|uniref:Peptidase A2 domain-containing protein n=1 Tax=Candidatus Taylorbacteria bacterium RIFCSPHIGHO2_02_FULL_45_35 TaxID=1802311 RepID=A0A1G2MRZ4_9BACT|nr:MAG: hypothetical protein A2836_01235 [Candidatus Taylorbacteria bacterium RIFCSPHIGHO2_01_FULL_45_63]OHA25772.1 MAG: hypothetical protein A3D56_01565 [Candidatus Taylorbacteria bacterium RIFCSPHIGHO2_02_FULL_45_35]OHA32289.1 MAG: hypothetical protein A3A22_01780 [Candidatus Taylorbacteria bacterium RIFCSPLOWO2_01_FULL_45_34b]